MNRKQIVLAVAVLFATAVVAFLLGTKVRGQLESPPPPAASPTALPSNPLDDAPPCVKVLASDEKYGQALRGGRTHRQVGMCPQPDRRVVQHHGRVNTPVDRALHRQRPRRGV